MRRLACFLCLVFSQLVCRTSHALNGAARTLIGAMCVLGIGIAVAIVLERSALLRKIAIRR